MSKDSPEKTDPEAGGAGTEQTVDDQVADVSLPAASGDVKLSNPDDLMHIISRMSKRIEDDAKITAKEFAVKIPAEEQQWLPMCPMPTDMCRVSPFFPLNKNDLKERDFLRNMVITKSSWGEIHYTGPRLSTFEEDVLMAVLTMMDHSEYRKETTSKGQKTYSYKGPILPLLKTLGYKGVGAPTYQRVLKSLEIMTVAGVKLIMGSEAKQREWIMSNILAAARWNTKTKELTVTINPYFYEMYISKSYTLIDIQRRMKIQSPIAKCMHRFIRSHRDGWWKGHFMTLSTALNLNLDLPAFKLKERIRFAIRELIKLNIITSNSKFETPELVYLQRTDDRQKISSKSKGHL